MTLMEMWRWTQGRSSRSLEILTYYTYIKSKHLSSMFRGTCFEDTVLSAFDMNVTDWFYMINQNLKCAYLLSHLPNERDEEVDGVLHT